MPWQSFSIIKGISASDSSPLPHGGCKAIYVGGPAGAAATPGGGGDITVRTKLTRKQEVQQGMTQGHLQVFRHVPVGTILPIEASHVMSTGTNATDLVTFHG